jgi:hypothetical protein
MDAVAADQVVEFGAAGVEGLAGFGAVFGRLEDVRE